MVAFFFLAILVVGCSPAQKNLSPDFGTSSHRAFAAQTLNSVGPENRSHVDTTPGDLSNQIYQKRYIKMLTEDKKDKESGSDQLKGLQ
ncbi:MAG: hypothetical protein CSA33_05405 [Desulfobulbus propionicus]|nr:MAG: hypothetical protein CSA33_05405 [Desulfobulbus propionicus]